MVTIGQGGGGDLQLLSDICQCRSCVRQGLRVVAVGRKRELQAVSRHTLHGCAGSAAPARQGRRTRCAAAEAPRPARSYNRNCV